MWRSREDVCAEWLEGAVGHTNPYRTGGNRKEVGLEDGKVETGRYVLSSRWIITQRTADNKAGDQKACCHSGNIFRGLERSLESEKLRGDWRDALRKGSVKQTSADILSDSRTVLLCPTWFLTLNGRVLCLTPTKCLT